PTRTAAPPTPPTTPARTAAPSTYSGSWTASPSERSGFSIAPSTARRERRLEDVDGRVHDDPHHVDEVPVDPRHLDAAVLLGGVVAAERADRHEQQQHQPDEHVRSVQPRQRVEDRLLRVVLGREADVGVLVDL